MVSVPVKMKPDHSQISPFNAGQEGVERHVNKSSGTRANIRCREYEECEKRHMKMEPVCIVNAGNKMRHRKFGDRMKWAEENIGSKHTSLRAEYCTTLFCMPQVRGI